MMKGLVLVLVLAVAAVTASCPCSDPSLCAPVSTPLPEKEVFIFQVSSANWQKYDWSILTTIVLFDALDPQLLCYAHQHGVRIVYGAGFPVDQLLNDTARQQFVDSQLANVKNTYADGINMDVEDPIALDSPLRDGYTQLMKQLYTAFKADNPVSSVTIDVAWSPDCIDGRCYDYVALSQYSDFLLAMDYDMQSQIFPPRECKAYANEPFPLMVAGTTAFIEQGVPVEKLVLGVPWYGYDYECINLVGDSCYIRYVPFRGVNCSDAAGGQIGYGGLMQLINNATTGRLWDHDAQAPYFLYRNSQTGSFHQVRYDDEESLSLRYVWAKGLGLRGIGMWNADTLDYSTQTGYQPMWQAMHKFF